MENKDIEAVLHEILEHYVIHANLKNDFWADKRRRKIYNVFIEEATQKLNSLFLKRVEDLLKPEVIKDPNDRIKDSNRQKVKVQNLYRADRNKLRAELIRKARSGLK